MSYQQSPIRHMSNMNSTTPPISPSNDALTNKLLYGLTSTTTTDTTTDIELHSPTGCAPPSSLPSPFSSPVLLDSSSPLQRQQQRHQLKQQEEEESNNEKVRRANAIVKAHKSKWNKAVVPHNNNNNHIGIDEAHSLETTATTMTTVLTTVTTNDDQDDEIGGLTDDSDVDIGQQQRQQFFGRCDGSGDGEDYSEESIEEEKEEDSYSSIDDDDDDDGNTNEDTTNFNTSNDVNQSLLGLVDDSLIGWEREQTEWEEKGARLENDIATWEQQGGLEEEEEVPPVTVVGESILLSSPIYGIPPTTPKSSTPIAASTTTCAINGYETRSIDYNNTNNTEYNNNIKNAAAAAEEWEKEKDDWRRLVLKEQIQRNADLRDFEIEKKAWEGTKANWIVEKECLEERTADLEEEKACLEERTVELEGETTQLSKSNAELVELLEVAIQTTATVMNDNSNSNNNNNNNNNKNTPKQSSSPPPPSPPRSTATITTPRQKKVVRIPKALHRAILPTMVWPIIPIPTVQIYNTFRMAQSSINRMMTVTYGISSSFRRRVWTTAQGAIAQAVRIQRGMGRIKQQQRTIDE